MLSQRCQQGCESNAKVRLSCPMGHHHRFAVAAAALVVALALSALHACCTASASAAPGSLACNTAISSASPAGASLQDHFGSSSVPTARPHDMRKEPTVTGRQRLTLDAHDPASTCSTSCPCHPLKEGNVAINASSSLRFEEVRDNQRLVRAYLLACARSRCQVALQSVFCENAACQCISQQCCATGLHLWLLRLALIRPLMFQYGLLYLSSGISHSDRKVVLPLRRQSVLLHHRGTDLRLFQPRWRGKACCDGP